MFENYSLQDHWIEHHTHILYKKIYIYGFCLLRYANL